MNWNTISTTPMISELIQVVGYKISIQKSIVFQYTLCEYSKNEINNSVYNSIKRIKYLRIHLTKEA